MKFGIITPVFDGCLDSLELLFKDLAGQTYTNWVWMLCGNGYSSKMESFVRQKSRVLDAGLKNVIWRSLGLPVPSIIYLHTDHEELTDAYALLANIGKRRDICLKQIIADYIFMIDADAKLLGNDMFQAIRRELERTHKDICIYKIIHEIGVLPIFPIGYAHIDMLNFCVKASLAKKVGYPTTVKPEAAGNDYWYFDSAYKASAGDYIFIDRIFGQHNGNNSYKNLMTLLSEHPHER
jgi:hypothetical protein